MVDCQVRPNNINDERIITAMRSLRRERFVPAPLATLAYAETEIALGNGRAMPAPLTVARLAHFAAVRPGDRVLVIAANTGYGAALLACCGAVVVALEPEPGLRAIAADALAAEGIDLRIVAGPLTEGAPQYGPYDIIVIEGAVDHLPASLAARLTDTGRVITILRQRGVGRLVRAEPSGGGFAHKSLNDCYASPLAAFSPAPAFTFR